MLGAGFDFDAEDLDADALDADALDADALDAEALDDGFFALDEERPLDFAALAEGLLVFFFLETTWRTLRTGRFQSTALSARKERGIASMPSA